MSYCIDYLNSILKLNLNTLQRDFIKFEIKNSKDCNIVSINTLDENDIIQITEFFNSNNFQLHECYKISFLFSQFFKDSSYIEGEVLIKGIPIEHSWNKYKGHYIDLNNDFLWKKSIIPIEYVSFLEFEYSELFKYIELGYYGPFIKEYFKNNYFKKYEL